MRKGLVIGLVVAVSLAIFLMVWVALIGTQLDEARVEQLDLESALGDLQAETEAIRTERETLQQQVDEHLAMIEQLKGELERTRGQAQGAGPGTTAP